MGLGRMKIFLGLFLATLTGCSVLKDAKTAFHEDVDGFRNEFARLYLKDNK